MITKGMMSSLRLDWKTPKKVLEELRKEFGLMYDPCPTNPTFDGLTTKWVSPAFVNPPYGKEIVKWCKKAYEENKKRDCQVIMLVPSRTDTRWWHDYIMEADEIRFIKGRLKFDDQKNSAPFPSAIAVFKSEGQGVL